MSAEEHMTPERRSKYILAVFVFVLVIGPMLMGGLRIVVDWIWFRQEGLGVLFTNVIKSQIELGGLTGVGFILIVGLNLVITQAIAHQPTHRVERDFVDLSAAERVNYAMRWVVWLAVLIVGYGLSHWGMAYWNEYLLAKNAMPMGTSDPVFGLDLSFFLFQLPFRWFLYYLAMVTAFGCLLSSVATYALTGGVWTTPRGPEVAPTVRTHLMLLAGVIMVILAYRMRLGMYDLLFSRRGVIYGAGYTDVEATLPVLKGMFYLGLLTAVLFVVGAVRGTFRPGFYGICWMAIFGLIGGLIYPSLLQHFVVTPNEIDKESPYIARAIEFTRKAYALDRFEEREFPAVENLTPQDLQASKATIHNVRLWDHRPLLTTFAQLQEIRTYYDFRNVDNDRYRIDGVYRQVSLSPRELDSNSLQSRTWINEHLTFTHGYGAAVGPVNEFTQEGLPELFIRDIPPVSTTSLRIQRPEIYFGEVPNEYCLVKTQAKELDYAAGDQNAYTVYQGEGGIPVGGFFRRLLFALRFGEWKILLSSDIKPESRLMMYRRVVERAARLTPFIDYDNDPYLVIGDDGALVWMLDGYTTSRWYPYSDPTPRIGNYMRNSVKATISAYDGKVKFYIADPSDPLIQAYARIFPGVFQPLEAMPKDLRAHVRYPEDFFSIQARKYAMFHMTDPRVFYNKEDLWRVAESAVRSASPASIPSTAEAPPASLAEFEELMDADSRALSGGAGPMTPYYTIMKLSGSDTGEEFILMVPFSPARKDNMIAWMAARCDGPNYGKVLVFAFPKRKLVYGPRQIESRIDQSPTISQQLTLWDQHGSSVIRGNLLVIPVLNSILYVQPLYLAASSGGGGLPQLTRVIVAYSDHIAMEPTLEAALNVIFGSGTMATSSQASAARTAAGTAPSPPAPPGAESAATTDRAELIREANQRFERAQQLLRQGDFAGYGEENRKLGEVLKRLAATK
jgi:hypothetical protein